MQIYLFLAKFAKVLTPPNTRLYQHSIILSMASPKDFQSNLNNDLFEFINSNINEDYNKLKLKYHGLDLPFNLDFAILQISARKKNVKKLSSFIADKRFLFPDYISSEQASDQQVSNFHASLVGKEMYVLDMTAGLGIDAMTIAKYGNSVVTCEIDEIKSYILSYNAEILGIDNFKSINCDCLSKSSPLFSDNFDVIFIDPARRDKNNRRTYSFRDCTPDILSALPTMQNKTKRILIKASPLLDITQIKREIPQLSSIHIVCVKGECKEVLVDINPSSDFRGIHIIDLGNKDIISDLYLSDSELSLNDDIIATEQNLQTGNYLYEPSAALMKLNCHGVICNRFKGLRHVASNTSLYISSSLFTDFPGRVSKIIDIPDKCTLKSIKGNKYNIVTRNYPLKVDEVRKKYSLKEGMDNFLYAFRISDKNKPVICITQRVTNIPSLSEI